MKFNCGSTRQARQERRARRHAEHVARLHAWHHHFLLVPRRMASGECRWLETIERKGVLKEVWGIGATVTNRWTWEYKAIKP